MADFFTQTQCDRCHQSLKGGRMMSMFNEDCLCTTCKQKEKAHPAYKKAAEADRKEIQKGNYNFKGIGF